MPQPFHLTAWLGRHPLTVLLLVATVFADAVVWGGGGYGDLQSIVSLALSFSQIGLLSLWCGLARISLVRCFILAIGVGLTGMVSIDDSLRVLNASVHGLLAVVIVAIEWVRGILTRKQYSLWEILSATTIIALVVTASRFAESDREGFLVAVAGAVIALVANETYRKAMPWRMLVLAATVALASLTGWHFFSADPLGMFLLFFLIQAIYYAISFEVLRTEKISWSIGGRDVKNPPTKPGG